MGAFRQLVLFGLLLILMVPSAFGSGFAFDGLGVKARGMGGAFRSIADDWSAAYYNPAGYNRIQDNMIAANLTVFHDRYWMTPDVLWGGKYETGFFNGQRIPNNHEIQNVPQGGILARLPIFGETVVGFSIMQTFDQNQSWELYQNIPAHNDTTFPDNQYRINLDGVAFQLTAARGFMEDRLSVGVGLALVRGDLIYSSVVLKDNPMPEPISDRPHDKIPEWYKTDGHGWGFGYRLGLLYEITDRLDIGLTYAGKSSIDLSGDSEFRFYMGENPYNEYYMIRQLFEEYLFLDGEVINFTADYDATLDIPASISGGVSYDITDQITVALDAEMVFWSQFKGVDFAFSNYNGSSLRDSAVLTEEVFDRAQAMMKTDNGVPIAWKDAGRVMAGGLYRPLSYLELRGGFSVDKSAMDWDNEAGITQVPQFIDLGTKFTYSFGFGFEVGGWNLDFATSYTHNPDLDIMTQADLNGDGMMDSVPGDYEADYYQTVLGISYRF